MTNKELVTVKVEQPVGSVDEDNPSMVYPLNYGYVERDGLETDVITLDDKQYAYIVGVDVAVDEFTGQLVAVARRRDDSEKTWIVAPEETPFTKQQLEEMVFFNEQFYDSFIEMVDEEMWDAYDADEHKLGYQVKRSMAKNLPEGVYHMVVNVYTVTADGKVLITERSRNKTHPLKWEVTGGSVLSGETAKEGALRELVEETGIDVTEDALLPLYNHVDHKKHVIYYAYVVVIPEEREITLQHGETMDYQYMTVDEFLEFVESDRFVPSEQKRFNMHKEDIINTLKSL